MFRRRGLHHADVEVLRRRPSRTVPPFLTGSPDDLWSEAFAEAAGADGFVAGRRHRTIREKGNERREGAEMAVRPESLLAASRARDHRGHAQAERPEEDVAIVLRALRRKPAGE